MKALLKRAPFLYTFLCRVKDIIKPPRRTWGKYYDGERDFLQKPQVSLLNLRHLIPSHIDTILDIGCGAGRNLLPFEEQYAFWGLDIVPYERIHWLKPFKNLRYTYAYLEDFTREIEQGKHDLTNVFVYVCATLMYLTKENQERFLSAIKKAGCTVYLFDEYAYGTYDKGEFFKLNPSDFIVREFGEPQALPYISYASF